MAQSFLSAGQNIPTAPAHHTNQPHSSHSSQKTTTEFSLITQNNHRVLTHYTKQPQSSHSSHKTTTEFSPITQNSHTVLTHYTKIQAQLRLCNAMTNKQSDL